MRARRSGLEQPVRPEAYFPHAQFTDRAMTLVIRSAGDDPTALAQPVRSVVRQIDADLPIARLATAEQLMVESMATRRLVGRLLAGFSALATLLAAIGIYGVMAYLVGRRTRELGIRLALGADPGSVLRLVLRQAGLQIAAGLALGLAGSVALTRFMASQLFGVSPTDPVTLVAVAALLAGAGFLASWLPARRAARVDPMRVLRAE